VGVGKERGGVLAVGAVKANRGVRARVPAAGKVLEGGDQRTLSPLYYDLPGVRTLYSAEVWTPLECFLYVYALVQCATRSELRQGRTERSSSWRPVQTERSGVTMMMMIMTDTKTTSSSTDKQTTEQTDL